MIQLRFRRVISLRGRSSAQLAFCGLFASCADGKYGLCSRRIQNQIGDHNHLTFMAIVKIDIVIKFSGWISLRIQLTADALVFWLTSCACRYCLFYIFMSDRIAVRMIMKKRMITVSNKKTTEITYIYSY